MPEEPRPASPPPSPVPLPGPTPPSSTETPAAPANPLTPEEQMALFAQDLKENDWGHQPC